MTQTTNASSTSCQCSILFDLPTMSDESSGSEDSAKLLKDYRQVAQQERGGHLPPRQLLENRVRGDRQGKRGGNLESYLRLLLVSIVRIDISLSRPTTDREEFAKTGTRSLAKNIFS